MQVRDLDKLRLVCLYALRYQKEGIDKGTLAAFSRLLPARPVPRNASATAAPTTVSTPALPHYSKFPELLLRVCGAARRTPNNDLFNRGVNAVVMQGIKGFSSQVLDCFAPSVLATTG
jgi:hypothetical protein